MVIIQVKVSLDKHRKGVQTRRQKIVNGHITRLILRTRTKTIRSLQSKTANHRHDILNPQNNSRSQARFWTWIGGSSRRRANYGDVCIFVPEHGVEIRENYWQIVWSCEGEFKNWPMPKTQRYAAHFQRNLIHDSNIELKHGHFQQS